MCVGCTGLRLGFRGPVMEEGHCARGWQNTVVLSSGGDRRIADEPEETVIEVSGNEECRQGKTLTVLMTMMAKTSTVRVTRPW